MPDVSPLIVWAVLLALWAIVLGVVFVPMLGRAADALLLASRRRRWARLQRPGFPVVTKDAGDVHYAGRRGGDSR